MRRVAIWRVRVYCSTYSFDDVLVGDRPMLVEVFAEDWTPLDGPDHSFEPGHHFEWIWLLDRHARLAGTRRHPCAEPLLSSAVALGVTRDLRVLDRVRASGAIVEGSVRLWPCTEAARAACCVSFDHERDVTAEQLLDEMGRRFLHENGTWSDRLDPNDVTLSTCVPASSLYHICGAVDAVEWRGTESGDEAFANGANGRRARVTGSLSRPR